MDRFTCDIRKAAKSAQYRCRQRASSFSTKLQRERQAIFCFFSRIRVSAWQRIHASRYIARAGKAAKISPPAIFHDPRRSYGSLLLNRGAGAEVIQELLGHADLRMSRRVYAHLMQRTIAKVVKKKLPSFGFERSNVRRLKP